MASAAVNSLAGVKGDEGNCSHLDPKHNSANVRFPHFFLPHVVVLRLQAGESQAFPMVKSENDRFVFRIHILWVLLGHRRTSLPLSLREVTFLCVN